MKSIDLESTLIAGLFGAALLTIVTMICNSNSTTSNSYGTLPIGFAVGAGVQVGVRLFGVS